MDEVSVLALKVVYLTVKGDLYSDDGGGANLDVLTLFPTNYINKSDIKPVINVARLPPNLQTTVESALLDQKGVNKDPIASLLSENHIRHLYSHFLGAGGTSEAKKASHPETWTKLHELIQHPGDEYDDINVAGMSVAITQHLRELGTNIANLWNGNIYNKMLDYLLRILLRVHLAPEREARWKERRSKAASRKAEENLGIRPNRRAWTRQVGKLAEELFHWENSTGESQRQGRDEAICQRLVRLMVSQPSSKVARPIPRIDDRLKILAITDQDDLPDILDEMQEDEDINDSGDDDEDGDAEEEKVVPTEKEPSRNRLRGLQAVIKMLLESPFITKPITKDDIQSAAHVGTEFTDSESAVAAILVNQLRPYVPKRRVVEDDNDAKKEGSSKATKRTKEPAKHFALMAPIVMIANQTLRIAGYSSYCRKLIPQISVASQHALHLNAPSIYE
ncbi:hypothetical protein BGW38_008227, partial [Lunasporangiospora selenospora]